MGQSNKIARRLCERAIVAAKNTKVAEINRKFSLKFLGVVVLVSLIDKPRYPSKAVQNSFEFLKFFADVVFCHKSCI